MERKIIVTDDNSKTLLIPELNETYHSTKGAIQEAKHVFIKAGLEHSKAPTIELLEMGFGTGLNALLTLEYAIKNRIKINYTALEAFPLTTSLATKMDYVKQLNLNELELHYKTLHDCKSNAKIRINSYFNFTKIHNKLEVSFLPISTYNLVYYDAFGPKIQPELWTLDALKIIQKSMTSNGIFTTYCAQGQFKRNLKRLNFMVESLPGPPGKREMTRATLA